MLSKPRIGFASGTGAPMNLAANITGGSDGKRAVTGSLDREGGTIFNLGAMRPRARRPGGRQRREARPDIAGYGVSPTAFADEILAGNIRSYRDGRQPCARVPREREDRRAARLDLCIVCDIRHTETTAPVVLPSRASSSGPTARPRCSTRLLHAYSALTAAGRPQADVVGVHS